MEGGREGEGRIILEKYVYKRRSSKCQSYCLGRWEGGDLEAVLCR